MTFQSCPDIVEAVIHATTDGKNIANVLHFQQHAYNQASIDQLSSLVDGLVGTNYMDITNVEVSYTETTVKGLQDIIDITSTNSDSAQAGADASASIPANVSPCVTLRTGFTGRSARGRFYAFPIGTAALSAVNTVSAAYATDIVLFLTDLLAEALAISWQMVVLSRVSGGAPRLLGIGTPVISVEMRNNTTDSQRRRLPAGH